MGNGVVSNVNYVDVSQSHPTAYVPDKTTLSYFSIYLNMKIVNYL